MLYEQFIFLQVHFGQDTVSIINVSSSFETHFLQILLIMYGDMTKTPVGTWPLST
jgi:hypothetical protein